MGEDKEKVFVDHDYTTVVANLILSEAHYVNSQHQRDSENNPVHLSEDEVFSHAARRVALAMDLAREYIEARK